MLLIEPCCTQKHLLALRSKLGADGTAFFHGYGDLSLAEMLPVLLTRYSEVEMMIVAPVLPDGAAQVIKRMMEKQWPTLNGKEKLDTISSLTLVTDLNERKSPLASTWLKDNRFGGRLTLHSVQQNDTAVLLPDIALYGNINLVYGGHFSAIATKNASTIQTLRKMYEGLARR